MRRKKAEKKRKKVDEEQKKKRVEVGSKNTENRPNKPHHVIHLAVNNQIPIEFNLSRKEQKKTRAAAEGEVAELD